MTTFTGTQNADSGLYFNVRRLRLTTLDRPGPLPGTEDDHYRRVPMVVMLAVAPLLGLMFVMFLPFIGFAMVLYLLGEKVAQLATATAGKTTRVMRPGWAPSLAFLSRSKPAARDRKPDQTPDAWTEEVERKMNEKDAGE